MLMILDHTKPYEVKIDVSNYAIGGALIQDGHLMVFKSRKLNDTKR